MKFRCIPPSVGWRPYIRTLTWTNCTHQLVEPAKLNTILQWELTEFRNTEYLLTRSGSTTFKMLTNLTHFLNHKCRMNINECNSFSNIWQLFDKYLRMMIKYNSWWTWRWCDAIRWKNCAKCLKANKSPRCAVVDRNKYNLIHMILHSSREIT